MTRMPTTPAQRHAQARKMTPGAAGGSTPLVAPTPRTRPLATIATEVREHVTWTSDGGVVLTAVSDPYEVLVGGTFIDVVVNLTAALTGDTDIDVLLNGSPIGTVTVASATTREAARFAEPTDPGDVVTLETTAAGAGTARAIAQLRVGT